MTSQVANRYAQALFDLAEESDLADKIYSEISEVQNILESNKNLYDVLRSPFISKEEKRNIVESIFNEVLEAYSKNFIKVLVDNDRTTEFKNVVEEYRRLINAKNNIVEGIVLTAVPIDDEKIGELEKKLSVKYKKSVKLKNKIDESIIGGVIVKIGNEEIDSSVKTRLNTLRESLIQVK